VRKDKSIRTVANGPRAGRQTAGFTVLGLPRGYRNNPSLLADLPDRPRRGFSLRNPANWAERECLYCGALMIVGKNRRTFCSVNCRRSYEFRQKNPLLAM
jgi:hypothetical protein